MRAHVVAIAIALLALTASAADHDQFQPHQIHIAYAGSPGEMRITWATVEKPTSPTAYVQIETSFQGFSAYTTSYFQKNPAFDPTADKFFHTARISNLQPSTSYKYYVSSLDAPTAKSETYSFTTQPMSPNGGYNMTYIVYGDMGVINSGNTVAAVTQTIRRNNPHVDFVFHIGDMSYADDYEAYMYEMVWNAWFTEMQEIMHGSPQQPRSVPYMVCPGNHEYSCIKPEQCPYATNFTAYTHRFAMPYLESDSETPMWYSFNYQGVHIVSVSTETDFDGAPEGSATFGNQLAWLKRDLYKASRNRYEVPWIIVHGHRPIYSSAVGYSKDGIPIADTLNLQRAMEDLFKQYGVDVFFSGHVHSYERTYPIYKGKATQHNYVDPQAPVYIIAGCAGNEEGLNADDQWLNKPDWSAFRYNQDWGYLTVNAARTGNQDQLTYQFTTSADSVVRDTLTIVKKIPAKH